MSEKQFKTEFKKWLQNKFILSQTSKWYLNKGTTIKLLNDKFSSFLTFSDSYSVGQLALLIKRNQTLLESILPIPNNPSYDNAVIILNNCLNKANEILTQYNLTSLVNGNNS